MALLNTLLLRPTTWDLCVGGDRNIAMASPGYSLAQDVGSAVRTFLGDAWYNKLLGIPYFDIIIGHRPPMALVRAQIEAQAMTVSGVVEARCVITGIANRQLMGNIIFIDELGAQNDVSF